MYKYDSVKIQEPKKTLEKMYGQCKKLWLYEWKRLKRLNVINKYGVFKSRISVDYSEIYKIKPRFDQSWKGLTYEQCMCSLYMEFIERFSMVHVVNNSIKLKYKSYLTWEVNNDFDFNKYANERRSNWLSAWSSFQEAFVWWIYEILERFAWKCFIEDSDNIISKSIDLFSIQKVFPELANVLENLKEDKKIEELKVFEIKFKDTEIYTYLCYFEDSSWAFTLWAWTHHFQRIALIRSITECIQISADYRYKSNIRREDSKYWCRKCMFTKYYFSKLNNKLQNDYKTNLIEKNETEIIDFWELEKKIIKDLWKMNLLEWLFYTDISHPLTDRSVLSIQIIWCWVPWFGENNARRILREKKEYSELFFCNNIEWLEYIYSKDYINQIKYNQLNQDIQDDIDNMLKKEYGSMLLELWDIELTSHLWLDTKKIVKNVEKKMKDDDFDIDSYYYFNTILSKVNKTKKDYLYLFYSYCRIWQVNYWKRYISLNLGENYILDDIKFKTLYAKYNEWI